MTVAIVLAALLLTNVALLVAVWRTERRYRDRENRVLYDPNPIRQFTAERQERAEVALRRAGYRDHPLLGKDRRAA